MENDEWLRGAKWTPAEIARVSGSYQRINLIPRLPVPAISPEVTAIVAEAKRRIDQATGLGEFFANPDPLPDLPKAGN